MKYRYWKLKDGSSVEAYSHNLDLPDRIEITKKEFDKFIEDLQTEEP